MATPTDSLTKSTRPRILMVLHLPPPIHGASMVGKYIQDSTIINSRFQCRYLNLTTAASLADIGQFSVVKLLRFLGFLYRLLREAIAFRPDLCYFTPNASGGAFFKDWIAVSLMKMLRTPVVLHFHNKGVARHKGHFLYSILYRSFFHNTSVILLSPALYYDIETYTPKNQVWYCPNGIQAPSVSPPSRERPHSPLQLLFLSNMMKEKGVLTLLDACTRLKQAGTEFICHFAGNWSDIKEEQFISQIKQKDLSSAIIVHGPVYGEEKLRLLANCDVMVFPTYYHNECFPLVLLEAMAHAKPCISTREGAIPTIVSDGTTGFLVEARNPDAIKEKIRLFADNPSLIHTMGAAARTTFESHYSLHQFEERLAGILQELVKKHQDRYTVA